MPTIHELLDDAQRQCDALTEEITAYKNANAANARLSDSLSATSAALKETLKSVRPLTEAGIKRQLIYLYAGVGASALLSLANLIIGIVR